MNFQKRLLKSSKKIGTTLFITVVAVFAVSAQESPYSETNKNLSIATGNNLYCAGYLETGTVDTRYPIIGAENEKDNSLYGDADVLYVKGGRNDGVNVGDIFSVIRPRGKFSSKFSKKGNLGFLVEEKGAVVVIDVKQDYSIVRVTSACQEILLGDLLAKAEKRESPKFEKRAPLEKYADSSNRPNGAIVLARNGVEVVAREHIVYVDLGREDGVNVGDVLTVYRPLGTGNLYKKDDSEKVSNTESGFESDRYRGGKYSIEAGRKKGEKADGAVVSKDSAREGRPPIRRVVGELIVLKVKDKTATAIVVRNTSEIHTGDRVEIK
ncbi:MAG: hypothetical protein ACK5NT_10220 [Pyrinomonadaceae bacterium]